MSDVLQQAKDIIVAKLTLMRNSEFLTDVIAEGIARELAEAGLLILDPLPDEDSEDFRLLDHEHDWAFMGEVKGDQWHRCTTCGADDIQ